MVFLLALCLAGAVAGKIFLGHGDAAPPQAPGGENYFLGEEDQSEK